jgi:hypothetical protein
MLLLIFHFVVSFLFGRLPTSRMLSGMAVEFAEKQKLGVLLVIRVPRSSCCRPRSSLLAHLSSLMLFSDIGTNERARFHQGVLPSSRAIFAREHVETGTTSNL